MTVGDSASRTAAYQTMKESAGFCRVLTTTLIQISGEDRASFLHNLCTADIKGLGIGRGCELFFPDVKGKTLGFGQVFANTDTLIYSTAPDQADLLLAHLNRYLIREDVHFADLSRNWQQWAVCGPHAESLCRRILGVVVESENLSFKQTLWEGRDVRCCRTDYFGLPGFLIQLESTAAASLAAAYAEKAIECDAAIFDFLRIQSGSPVFGKDITSENLPQEIDRDARAISFKKGCYLGQETIARIDALGRVQRLLRKLEIASVDDPPMTNELLTIDNKPAGRVTSVARNPVSGQIVALGIVRRDHADSGVELSCGTSNVKVV